MMMMMKINIKTTMAMTMKFEFSKIFQYTNKLLLFCEINQIQKKQNKNEENQT